MAFVIGLLMAQRLEIIGPSGSPPVDISILMRFRFQDKYLYLVSCLLSASPSTQVALMLIVSDNYDTAKAENLFPIYIGIGAINLHTPIPTKHQQKMWYKSRKQRTLAQTY